MKTAEPNRRFAQPVSGRDALSVCGLGPESLQELFETLRMIDPSEVKAKMEELRGLGVQMDIQDRSHLN